MKVLGIIPARYGSTRLPGKPLLDICGKSMIQRVYEQCLKSKSLDSVIVATDDNRIFNHVTKFGGNVILTSTKHRTGTDRCGEVIDKYDKSFDLVVNIQGDEPLIDPLQIDQLVNLFNYSEIDIATLAKKSSSKELFLDRNHPKAIIDKNSFALNFCREIKQNHTRSCFLHVGIYAFKKNVLEKICQLKETKNEKKEKLEQLRWLDNHYRIKVGITNFESYSIDTLEDLKKIQQIIR